MDINSRVFVIQNQFTKTQSGNLVEKFDLSPARRYGELTFLLSPTAKPFRANSVLKDLQNGLKDYSDRDYLLLIGNPALIGFAAAIAANFNDGNLQLLQWSGDLNQYLVISNNVFSV